VVENERSRTPTPLKVLRLVTAGVVATVVALFVAVRVDATSPAPVAPTPVDDLHVRVGGVMGIHDHRGHLRVLFVGNSAVYANDLPGMLHHLAAGVPGGQQIDSIRFVAPAARLRRITGRRLRTLITRLGPAAVVVEDDSFVSGQRYSFSQVGAGDTHWVRAAGARPVLWAEWFFPNDPRLGDSFTATRLRWSHMFQLFYTPVVRFRDIAFSDSASVVSSLALHRPSRTAPSRAGTYLSAAVLRCALTGSPSLSSTYTAGLPTAQARALRQLADRQTCPLPSAQ
jgi:hypothetical protein